MKLTQLWCASLLVFFPAIAFAQSPLTGDAYISNLSSSVALVNDATSPSLVVQASRPDSSFDDPQFVVIAPCRWSCPPKTELLDRNGKAAERTPQPPIGKILPRADNSTAVTGRASPLLRAQNGAIKRGSVQETT
jgi:hypothetical protein